MRCHLARTLFLLGCVSGALSGYVWAAPSISIPPADVVTNAGGAAAFRVVASGAGPLTYQWFRDGLKLAGETGSVLAIPRAAPGDAGRYSVEIAGERDGTVSLFASLTVGPQSTSPIVDTAFRGDPALTGQPTALLPLDDGRVILATRTGGETSQDWNVRAELIGLLPDGRIDPGFRKGVATADEFDPAVRLDPPEIRTILVQPDGHVVVAGHFIAYNGVPCPGLVRLNRDGQVDPTFVTPLAVSRNARGFSIVAALQPDGKILVAGDDSGRVWRLLPDGRQDISWQGRYFSSVVNAIAVNAAGRVFVGSGTGSLSYDSLTALRTDGTLDPDFPVLGGPSVQRVYPSADGGVVVSTQYDAGPNLPGNPYHQRWPAEFFRLLPDGTRDAAFPSRKSPLVNPPRADGALLWAGRLIAADGTGETPLNLGVGYLDFGGVGYALLQVHAFGRDGKLWVAGNFSTYNGVETNRVTRLNLVATEGLVPPALVAVWVEPKELHPGEALTVRAAAAGSGPLTYQWSTPAGSFTTSEPTISIRIFDTNAHDISVTVANSAGSATEKTALFAATPGELRILEQPRRVSLAEGRVGLLTVRLAASSVATRAVWRRDGVVVLQAPGGATPSASLGWAVVNGSAAGAYTVTFSDAAGRSVTSDPMIVTVGDGARFVNLSTRAYVGGGDEAAILGFVIPPGPNRQVLLRGIGPSLADLGVTGALAEARLDLYGAAGQTLARAKAWNPGWSSSPTAAQFAEVGAFPLAAGSHDAALRVELAPGSYTVRLAGLNGATGIGLVELYEADNRSDRLSNLSTRVVVRPDVPAMAGFVVRGPVSKRILVRAIGPTLAAFGVAGALADARIEVRDGDGRMVAANDDWASQLSAGAVAAETAALRAFGLPEGSRDAALIVSLPEGSYSALVSGGVGQGGVALVEVYELP